MKTPLTLIVAPAGFGKTTLLVDHIANCEMPVAWLSLDKNDNQASRFLTYLVAALQGADRSLGEQARELLAGFEADTPETILTSLINDLELAQVELAVVLDDYHLINSQEVHEAVTFLVEHCPGNFHLVIASRSDPVLPLARWRVRGLMAELRTADLRFSVPEASVFLNEIMDLGLDARSVATLAQRTEGWVAGLQMAALSMRDREDVGEFIQGFSGTNRYILDYLLSEVLNGQTPEIQHFLLYTSVLESMNAALCVALLDNKEWTSENNSGEAQAVLEELERANLFLAPLDEERSWYRYHPLFADLLQAQLQKSGGGQVISRQKIRAAEWHAKHGSILEAINYASAAADDARVERFIEQNYMELVKRGEQAWLRSWTGKLSLEQVCRRPWLCVYVAYSHSWFGELDEAERLLAAAEKHIQVGDPVADSLTLECHIAYIKSRVTAMRGDLQRAIELCLQARSQVPDSNLPLLLDTSITLGYEYFLSGDLINASQILEETIRSGRSSGAVINTVAAACLLGRMYAIEGQLNKSQETYISAASGIPEDGSPHLGAWSLVENGMAENCYERNDMRSAMEHIQRALELLPWWEKADDWILAYITLSRIHLWQKKLEEAQEALNKASQFINSRVVFGEARTAFSIAQARLWMARGDWPAARRWADSLAEETAHVDDPFRNQFELLHTMRARILAAGKKLPEAAILLAHLEETARKNQRKGRLIEIEILKALLLQKMGEPSQAEAALTESLALAEPEGYTRLFLDEGQPLRTLLGQRLAHIEPGRLRDYAAHLLADFEAESRHGQPVNEGKFHLDDYPAEMEKSLVEPLSEREMEVLQLVAQGKGNKEIARELVVAAGTVKAHTASIYRKLEAGNRTEAVARARILGLLP